MNNRNQILIERATEAGRLNQSNRQQDPFRLSYHLMPPVGLLNDPNGFVYFKGKYHLFYQWNPFETKHGAKFWGHYSSSDLINWQEEPIALAPSEPYDKDGCYSGSAIEHDGKLYLFYTGNVKNEANERKTFQCLAVSDDGINFEKKGPIIDLPTGFTPHFRDPKVWRENDQWYMVIGAQDEMKRGSVVLYTSNHLYNWHYEGIIAGSHMQNLSDFGYMWECPDLFTLQDKDILLVCPQGLEAQDLMYQNIYQSGYFIGELDRHAKVYTHGDFQELDRGFDFYAAQTTIDPKGRRLLFAWMGITDETEPYHPTIDYQWIHTMTLPRELILNGDQLCQRPVEELKHLRRRQVTYQDIHLHDEERGFNDVSGQVIEMLISDIKMDHAEEFKINIRGYAELIYNNIEKTLTLKRKSLVNEEMEERAAAITALENLQVYLDTSSIEIFVNGGKDVFTARIFPDPANETIGFQAKGKVQFQLKKWDLA